VGDENSTIGSQSQIELHALKPKIVGSKKGFDAVLWISTVEIIICYIMIYSTVSDGFPRKQGPCKEDPDRDEHNHVDEWCPRRLCWSLPVEVSGIEKRWKVELL
jgi:hypothetical protein